MHSKFTEIVWNNWEQLATGCLASREAKTSITIKWNIEDEKINSMLHISVLHALSADGIIIQELDCWIILDVALDGTNQPEW